MEQQQLTTEQMTDSLRERALRICQLSLKITTRELAQATAEVKGYVNWFDADIRPLDATTAPEDERSRPELASLHLEFYHYNFYEHEQNEERYKEQASKADQYIAYLELLLAQDKPVTIAAMQATA